jgi:copper chaperone NosL
MRGLTRREALRWLLTTPVALWLGIGHDAHAAASPTPRPIQPGDDRCPACGMAVMDARFAAQAFTEGGRTLVYDAIECLADHLNGHAGVPATVTFAWLADRAASEPAVAAWLEADRAVVLHHRRLRTPMGGGLAAFDDAVAARTFADEQRLDGAESLSWDEVLARGVARPWVPVR